MFAIILTAPPSHCLPLYLSPLFSLSLPCSPLILSPSLVLSYSSLSLQRLKESSKRSALRSLMEEVQFNRRELGDLYTHFMVSEWSCDHHMQHS